MELTRENRQFQRVSFACELTVTPMPSGKPQPATSVDISLGGVGFYSKFPLNKDQIIQIDFRLKDEDRSSVVERVQAKVVYARSYWEGTRVGVEFSKPLNEVNHPILIKRLQELASERQPELVK